MVLTEKSRAGWKDTGYARGCGSMRAAPPPVSGFKRLYYLTGPDHAVSNIMFGRIKLSRFADLNDPFEPSISPLSSGDRIRHSLSYFQLSNLV
jgi:hypothetical protein